MKILKHLNAFIETSKHFDLSLGVINFLWFANKLFPSNLYFKLTTIKHRKIQRYLNKNFGPIIYKYKTTNWKLESVDNESIWVCWFQGEENMPLMVKTCFKSIEANSNGHPVVLITLNNYKDFVNIPENIEKRFIDGKILPAHFSDILRTALLYKYGGLWLDATILLTAKLPPKLFQEPFYTVKGPQWGYFVTECKWSNYFLSSRKNNPLFGGVLELFYAYLEKEDRLIDYFLMDYFVKILYEENSSIKKLLNDVPFNNLEINFLRRNINETFDDTYFNKITSETYAHKLTWKGSFRKLDNNQMKTYYGHIINLY
jgi:hypothetical protein